MSRVCVLGVCVVWEVSRDQSIVQVGKGLKAQRVQALPWQEVAVREVQPQQGGSVHAALFYFISEDHKCPLLCCRAPSAQPSPDVSAVAFVTAEAPSSGSRRSGAAPELPWAALAGQIMWEENSDTNLR